MGRGSPGPTVGGGALRPTGAVAQGSPRQERRNKADLDVNVQDHSGENIMGRGSPGPTVGGGALRPTGSVAQGSPRQENDTTNLDENIQDYRTSADESNTSEHTAAAISNSVSFHAGGALCPTGVGGKRKFGSHYCQWGSAPHGRCGTAFFHKSKEFESRRRPWGSARHGFRGGTKFSQR